MNKHSHPHPADLASLCHPPAAGHPRSRWVELAPLMLAQAEETFIVTRITLPNLTLLYTSIWTPHNTPSQQLLALYIIASALYIMVRIVDKTLHLHHNNVCLRNKWRLHLVQLPFYGQRTFDSF